MIQEQVRSVGKGWTAVKYLSLVNLFFLSRCRSRPTTDTTLTPITFLNNKILTLGLVLCGQISTQLVVLRPVGHQYLYIIIEEKLETLTSMESYLPTSDRHAASWIFSDGPSKQLGVVKLRYNALKLFFIMSLFYANVPVSASDSLWRQFLKRLTQLRRPFR